jgi:hypothetical protein
VSNAGIDSFDEEYDRWLDEQMAKEDPRVQGAKCCVCNRVWVDVLNGQDTCLLCLPKGGVL